jgi:hypothetical protein
MRKVLSGMYAQISESRDTTVSPSSDTSSTDLDADVEFLASP